MCSRPRDGQSIVETKDAAGAPARLGQRGTRLLLLEQQVNRGAEVLDDAISAARQALESREGGALVGTSFEAVLPGFLTSLLRRHPTLVFLAAVTTASRLAWDWGSDFSHAVRVICSRGLKLATAPARLN